MTVQNRWEPAEVRWVITRALSLCSVVAIPGLTWDQASPAGRRRAVPPLVYTGARVFKLLGAAFTSVGVLYLSG